MSPWKNFCGDKARKSWGKGGGNSHGKISIYLIASFLHGLLLLFATVASSFFLLIHRVYLIGSKWKAGSWHDSVETPCCLPWKPQPVGWCTSNLWWSDSGGVSECLGGQSRTCREISASSLANESQPDGHPDAIASTFSGARSKSGSLWRANKSMMPQCLHYIKNQISLTHTPFSSLSPGYSSSLSFCPSISISSHRYERLELVHILRQRY